MSRLLDRLNFFIKAKKGRFESFAHSHGVTTDEARDWEEGYRKRWAHDKIVRSTHGVNCTGSCSWKIYVKGGIVTWETQQTDYPRTRPELPNHEPRGCPRGASYSWYLYSAQRVKYPLIRARLLELWREARRDKGPVAAWASIVEDSVKRTAYTSRRGRGGFVRADWEEVTEMIAAANAYTIKKHGPDRIAGFSPIPAMSMVSYAAGTRYLSLLGGVCLSFYDWYCDLPPASPQTWGEQTDVPESADWYNASFLMMWGSNVPQTRTPDAHFMTEARYRGTQVAVVSPDYNEAAKFADVWLGPKQGTDAALGLAMAHVILKEFYLDRQSGYFQDYARRYTDLPMLVKLVEQDGHLVPERQLRSSDFDGALGETNHPEWKTVAIDADSGEITVPRGSIGFRWGEQGKWNLEEKDSAGNPIRLRLSNLDDADEIAEVALPYFGGKSHDFFEGTDHPEVLRHKVPVKKVTLKNGEAALVATVFDLLVANHGLDRGLGGEYVAQSYDDLQPYTPAWAEKITGVPADRIIAVARAFADNAEKTCGKSMVILGAGINHWYHMDMHYRAIINLLVLCGCIGQEGGGWAHYVGQEKLRPQPGWLPLAFALDWNRPPRQQNSTSFWYLHTDQWRYETLAVSEILSPTAPKGDWQDLTLVDYNLKAVRMGWLPAAPQLQANPLDVGKAAAESGRTAGEFVADKLKSGELKLAWEDPDHPDNWPRNLFVWRSNLLGSSSKGHEYFLRHLLGTHHGVKGEELGGMRDEMVTANRPREVRWHEKAPEGKLDLLVTLDFRMSTTCLYSDIVLPTASWYEKHDLNTSDMHPFIHPLTAAVNPVFESRSDWDIYKGLAGKFSELAPEAGLGMEKDAVLVPLLHDSPGELAQSEVRDWKRGECEPVPGKTMPGVALVERDYPGIYQRFTSIGPLMEKAGNACKGIAWKTDEEIEFLRHLNGTDAEGRPKIESDIQAAEMILTLAPETNGHVAVKAWSKLSQVTGRDHTHLAKPRAEEKIRFRDIVAQPRKIITSPVWSGIDSEEVCYNAGYTNVHERIPWRTLSGRQQLYQDHPWMRAFGEALCVYKPPIDTKTIAPMLAEHGKEKHLVLNFITPHQKWGIHSTYTDNLIMLTLARGGPLVWLNEEDARQGGIADNDWVEVFNANGALVARAVVSQRIRPGTLYMYHAQEKIINTPGSKVTGHRGGIHNSVTRTVLKPTHMIGGYAQLSWGFNYYGTVGSNRDEFVIVRKTEADWMEE
ncbi:nitrate reductase/nitrite oxidoreductase, alpha subunit [Methylomarinovum tepidoasis]|uniref:nitrate reductase (quinone) n=1 Tax=Methylomarinovum tepidoasis TaxID=2840183 RepID=A0AAU9CSU4_9GAMM|nr:nitrate reductase subunit alpha [Methylomarinovum sp. IN45]BCX87670.1 nitrate reductase/nitrite oxidoreductase, alpha subunit [Methylomarinovum sp. IN45]